MSTKGGDFNSVGSTYHAGDGGPGGKGGDVLLSAGNAYSVNFKVLAQTVDPAISKLYDSLGRLSDETSDALWAILTRLRKLELQHQLTKEAVDEIELERFLGQVRTSPAKLLEFLRGVGPLWQALEGTKLAADLAGWSGSP